MEKSAIFAIAISFVIYGVNSQGPVIRDCLQCICEAASDCDLGEGCTGDVCGPFKLTWSYWADSGKPTVNAERVDSQTAYSNCATDFYCSITAIQNYMEKFKKDCNGDGVINCYDFVAIHKFGVEGCSGALPPDYYERYVKCSGTNSLEGGS